MPKALTREEQQAITREVILAAAQQVFLTSGYHGTTIAKIAKAAGRTHGALYGHFASKEALGQEILRQHFEEVLARLATALIEVDDIAAKLVVLEQQWRILSAETDWTTLAAEFVFATRQDPEQAKTIAETTDGLRAAVRVVLLTQAASIDLDIHDLELLDRAIVAIIGSGIGLVIAQVLGTVDADGSAAGFIETFRLWLVRLGVSPHQLEHPTRP
ncbi:TetR/AcrR family transcriptional regulator [Nocardia sp. XZ_19_385]|uniref:TetR/AcrR family transcriptional regulator n=1 Tax=Nocardia sp. XZ_19_385 TaxID=2769488 RepID=UPI00188FBD18|nr:TetR/AcrR family transcriptional regulator [Nocardia sp. XZ_19_385]